MTVDDPRSEMLSDMAGCAYRLGMAFGAAAEKAQGREGWLAYFNAFDRCFFAVRVATALELRLRRTEPREAASDREALIERADPPEREDREDRGRGYDERDRDRETERASLPILLRTLDGVVADASALPGPEPAELPTLRELIAHAKAHPTTAEPAPTRAPPMPPPPTHRASNVGQVLAARRATGPPRR